MSGLSNSPAMLLRYAPLVFLAGLLALLLAGLLGEKHIPQTNAKPFPSISIASLHSEKLISLPHENGQPWVLNIFASWCLSCIAEHGAIKNWKETNGAATPLVGIAWRDKPEDTQTWLDKHGNIFDQVGKDDTGEAAISLGLTGVPETYVIDASGVIIANHKGPLTKKTIQSWLLPALEKARP